MKKVITKRTRIFALMLMGLMTIISCKSGETMSDSERSKALSNLTEQLSNNDFKVNIEVMQPFNTAATTAVLNQLAPYSNGNSTGRINVAGDGHYVMLTTTNVKGNLPYMGQQLQGGGRNVGRADNGVDMDGLMRDRTLKVDERKGRVVVEFNTDDPKNRSENYNVVITALLNGQATVQVNSSLRSNIRYTGRLVSGEDSM